MAEFKSVLRLQKVDPEGKVLQEEEIDLRRGIFGEGDPTEETEGTAGLSYYNISDIKNGNVVEWVCVSDSGGRYIWMKKKGNPGKDGKSVTIESITESNEDGGTNVVNFSDGKKLNVKNGSRGLPGKTPEKGKDYFTDADKQELVTEVLETMPAAEGVDF